MRLRFVLLACAAPLLSGASDPAGTEPDAGIGRACRYRLNGAYAGRLICYSEQQYERGSDKPGAHLDEDPANVARVQVDFTLEEPPRLGIQSPTSVSGAASMRLVGTGRWLATTSPEPKAKKLGSFAVTITDMRTVRVKGKDRLELHGEVDARLVSMSNEPAADVELHATF